jgi:hypothetical protein
VEGPENTPKEGICADGGMAITGAGFIEMTIVALRVIDPEESVAVRPIATPVITPGPASLVEGVPDSVRLRPSKTNQLGPVDKLYVMGKDEEKVELGNVYAKGCDTRATVGT